MYLLLCGNALDSLTALFCVEGMPHPEYSDFCDSPLDQDQLSQLFDTSQLRMATDINPIVGRATANMIYAETLFKDLPSSEDQLFELLNEAVSIMESICTPSSGDVEQPLSDKDAIVIRETRIRVHKLRVTAWTGSPDKLALIQASCRELGKLKYSLTEHKCQCLNAKLEQALERTMVTILASIDHLHVERGVLKSTSENLNLHGRKSLQRLFNGSLKGRSRSTSCGDKRRSSKKQISDGNELASLPSIAQNIQAGYTTVDQLIAAHDPSPSPSPQA